MKVYIHDGRGLSNNSSRKITTASTMTESSSRIKRRILMTLYSYKLRKPARVIHCNLPLQSFPFWEHEFHSIIPIGNFRNFHSIHCTSIIIFHCTNPFPFFLLTRSRMRYINVSVFSIRVLCVTCFDVTSTEL